MALPAMPNNTCDIYRSGNTPPSTPDVEAVPMHLRSNYSRRKKTGESMAIGNRYTHVMLVALSVDVRDGWTDFTSDSGGDTAWIPDKDGNSYKVIFVERHDRGLPGDHKCVFLHRDSADFDDVY